MLLKAPACPAALSRPKILSLLLKGRRHRHVRQRSAAIATMAGGYSLAAKCGSEIIATCLVIYLGLSIIANELLPKTKGSRMGWLGVAFGFGLSFGVVIYMFGYISAHLNPASCLALWIIGKLSFTQFLALSASEVVGAFLGACLVFLHYVPHFNTLPEPPAPTADDLLLRSRDALSPEALNIASYDTRPQVRVAKGGGSLTSGLGQAIRDIRFYFAQAPVPPEEHHDLVEVALGRAEMQGGAEEVANRLRRRSVQVCDVHRRLQDMSMEEFKEKLNLKTGLHRAASINLAQLDRALSNGSGHKAGSTAAERKAADLGPVPPRGDSSQEEAHAPAIGRESAVGALRQAYKAHVEKFGSKQSALYDAAIVADQNAKLSIFCTRPAIYTPVFNFLCEFMCTTALVFGARMMDERSENLVGEFRALLQPIQGFFIGFYVFICVLALGGPTGIAANPARDFGPRLAHALLPIAGKGSSEWIYSWIPIVAPLAGGAAAGGLYLAVQTMNHSALP
ncbi:hypothetical protein ABPG77_003691 [Micractinium sp. CCAP 211/92]